MKTDYTNFPYNFHCQFIGFFPNTYDLYFADNFYSARNIFGDKVPGDNHEFRHAMWGNWGIEHRNTYPPHKQNKVMLGFSDDWGIWVKNAEGHWDKKDLGIQIEGGNTDKIAVSSDGKKCAVLDRLGEKVVVFDL